MWNAAEKRHVAGQFLRYSMVGTVGFVVDSSMLYLAMYGFGLDPYSGRVLSFLVGVTTTWMLNRRFTFPAAPKESPRRQWATFVAFMLLGASLNYATYAAIIYYGPDHPLTPLAGVAAGAIAGLSVNFTTSRLFVFR